MSPLLSPSFPPIYHSPLCLFLSRSCPVLVQLQCGDLVRSFRPAVSRPPPMPQQRRPRRRGRRWRRKRRGLLWHWHRLSALRCHGDDGGNGPRCWDWLWDTCRRKKRRRRRRGRGNGRMCKYFSRFPYILSSFRSRILWRIACVDLKKGEGDR